MEETRKDAFYLEPEFKPFGDEYKRIPCINNSRAAIDKVIADGGKKYVKCSIKKAAEIIRKALRH